jgi:hypothetical protein
LNFFQEVINTSKDLLFLDPFRVQLLLKPKVLGFQGAETIQQVFNFFLELGEYVHGFSIPWNGENNQGKFSSRKYHHPASCAILRQEMAQQDAKRA